MKSISTIIVSIMIIIVVVIIVSLFYTFSLGIVTAVSQAATSSTSQTIQTTMSCFRIVSIYNNKIFIRNCGPNTVTNGSLSIFIDNVPFSFNMTPSSIGTNAMASITLPVWGIPIGDHTLRLDGYNTEILKTITSSLPDSCVMSLDFDEGQGNIAHDSSSYHNDGTLGDGICTPGSGKCPQRVDGKFGKALQFNDTNDYVTVQHNSILSPVNAISISAWVILRVVQPPWSKNILSKSVYALNQDWDGPSAITFYVQNVTGGPDWDGKYNLPLNQWIYALGNYDGSNTRIYIDGILQNSHIFSGNLITSSDQLKIGVINGTLDSVRIYNQALTPDDTVVLKMK